MKNKLYSTFLLLAALLYSGMAFGQTNGAAPFNQNTWNINPEYYPNSMVITAVINIEGEESMDPNDRVAAFQGTSNAIRGLGSPVYVPALDRHIVSLFVYSENGASVPLNFYVYDASSNLVLPCTTTETFGIDKLVGSFAAPDTIFTIRIQANFTKDDVLCAADTFGFAQANVTGGTPPYNYQWSTGGTADRISNIGAGRYFLTITDDRGFNKVDSIDILNLNRPILSPVLAAAPADTICEGQDVYLFSFSPETESPAYEWYDNFGNFLQASPSLFLPSIDVSRQFFVQTNVRNCLSPPTSIPVTVRPVPSADFAIGNASPTPQDSTIFTPQAVDPTLTYSWDFGDGNSSTMAVPTHAYAVAGNYIVRLSIRTPEGCTVSSLQFISVSRRDIDVLLDIVELSCASDTAGAIAVQAINGVPPYQYAWSNGSSTAAVSGLAAGTYGLTVSDAQGNTRELEFVLEAQGDLPPPEVIINGGQLICAGDNAVLTAFADEPGLSFRWYDAPTGGNLLYSGEQLVLYGLSGSRTLWAEARKGSCASVPRAEVVLQVGQPSAAFAISAQAAPLGNPIVFSALIPNPSHTYTWDFGDGATAMGPGPHTHLYGQAGTFEAILTVSTPEGCRAQESRFVNVWGGALQLQPDVQLADCAGNASGAITLQVLGGQPPYSFQWSNGAIQPAISGLLPGAYGVTVQDANGFSANAQVIVGAAAPAPDAPTLIVNGGRNVCAGDDIWIDAYSDNPDAVFYWYTSAVSPNPVFVGSTLLRFNIQEDATYYVAARLGNCVSSRTLVTIPVSAPNANFTTDFDIAYVGEPLLFIAQVNSQSLAYTWEWGDNSPNGNQPSQIHTYNAPGIYEVVLRVRVLQTGCEAEQRLRIQVLEQPTGGGPGGVTPLLALASSTPALCGGSASGTLSAQAAGGQLPYNYQWSNGSTAAFQSGVAPGTYFLSVTDGLGATAVASATVGAGTGLPAPIAIVNGGAPACPDRPLWLAAASGGSGVDYRWYDSPTGGQPLYLGQAVQYFGTGEPDTLYLQASQGGCVSARLAVPIAYEMVDANFSLSPATAEVGQAITAATSTTAPGYQYNWDFGDGQLGSGALSTVAYAQAGLYEVVLQVRTPSGCTAEQRRFANVYEPGGTGISLAFNLEYPYCPEDESGIVTPLVFGGQPPYAYEWGNGSTASSLIGLSAGTYSLTVTDGNGQMASGTAELFSLQPAIAAPDVALAGSSPACIGSSAWLAATGGQAGTQYLWYGSESGNDLAFIGSYLELNGLSGPQAFYVEARYQGCVSDSRSLIMVETETADASFAVTPSVMPVGEIAVFTASAGPAGQSYSWSFGDGSSASGALATHAYNEPGFFTATLEAVTPNGCTATASQVLRVLPFGGFQLAATVTDAQCGDSSDGSISLSITGGQPPYSIEWDNGSASTSRTGLAPGNYGLIVSDALGNIQTENISVGSVLPAIELPEVTVNGNLACPGEPLLLAAETNVAGADYRWYDAAVGGNLLYAGPSFPIGGLSEPAVVYVEALAGNCQSGRAMIELPIAGPDAGFSLSPANPLAGEEVRFLPNELDTTYAYAWAFGDGSTSALAEPLHVYTAEAVYLATLTVTDSTGCSVSATQPVTVGFGQALGVLLEATDVQCQGDQNGAVLAQVYNGQPPYEITWSNGEQGAFLQGLPTGTYAVTVTDAEGATATAEVQVASATGAVPAPQLVSNDDNICPDQFLLLYAFDNTGTATNFFWYGSPSGGGLLGAGSTYSQQGLSGQSQTFYVEAAAGTCRSAQRTAITISSEQPNEGFTASASTVVEGSAVSFVPLLVDSSYTYQWAFGDGVVSTAIFPTHTYNSPGQYTVSLTVTSSGGCAQTEQRPAFIQVVPEGALSILFDITQAECAGDSTGIISTTVLNGVPPYQYAWSNGATGSTLTGLPTGTYGLTVTDSEGSSSVRNTQITPIYATPNPPMVSANVASPLCSGQATVFTASSGQPVDQYYWYADGQLLGTGFSIVRTPTGSDTLQLRVQSQRGSCFSGFAEAAFPVQQLDAAFTVANGGNVQAGQSASFAPAQTGYSAYLWTFGDGSTSTQMMPQHTYAQAGQYEARLRVESQSGCTAVSAQMLAVQPEQQFQLVFTVMDVRCEASEGGEAEATPQGGNPPYNYLWSNGQTGSLITGLPAGSYSVTVTDNTGNAATGTVTVENLDQPIPAPVVLANGGAPVCKDEPAYLSGSVLGLPNAEVLWFESAAAAQPIYQGNVLLLPGLAESTTFYTEALVDGCRSAREAVPVAVQAPEAGFSISPSADLEEGDLVQFAPDLADAGFSYYWSFGDNGWSTAMTPFYFYNLPGIFDVMLEVTDSDGCTNTLVKEDLVSVAPFQGFRGELDERSSQLAGSPKLQGLAFPNPFVDELNAVFKVAAAGTYQLELVDAFGRVLLRELTYLDNQPTAWQLQLTDRVLPSGFYFLRLSGQGERAVIKLIKQ